MLALSTSQIAMDTLLVNSDPVACVVVALLVEVCLTLAITQMVADCFVVPVMV